MLLAYVSMRSRLVGADGMKDGSLVGLFSIASILMAGPESQADVGR